MLGFLLVFLAGSKKWVPSDERIAKLPSMAATDTRGTLREASGGKLKAIAGTGMHVIRLANRGTVHALSRASRDGATERHGSPFCHIQHEIRKAETKS